MVAGQQQCSQSRADCRHARTKNESGPCVLKRAQLFDDDLLIWSVEVSRIGDFALVDVMKRRRGLDYVDDSPAGITSSGVLGESVLALSAERGMGVVGHK